ncbi:hypothetical protein PC120_g21404 [Phytophthora cactorum]|nr:hypothetical protein PC120_g21404 [Phytophthora cactorum]
MIQRPEQRVLGRLPPVDPVGGIRSVPRHAGALYAKHYWPKDKSGPLWQHAPEMNRGNSSMTDSHHKI